MPKCRYCDEEISRLDKDICPYCGGLNPLKDSSDYTEDITETIAEINLLKEEQVKLKSRLIAGLLAIFFGIFGGHLFYLGKNKLASISLSVSLAFIAGLGSILFFTTTALHNAFGYLLPYFILELFMIIVSILIFTRNDIKDAKGDYLK